MFPPRVAKSSNIILGGRNGLLLTASAPVGALDVVVSKEGRVMVHSLIWGSF